MAEINEEVLRTWAEDLTRAADLVLPPGMNAAHDQTLAEARERLGELYRLTDIRETIGGDALDRKIVAGLLRAMAEEITREADTL